MDDKLKKSLLKVSVFIIVILTWEFLPRSGIVYSYILPPLSQVLTRMFGDLFSGYLLQSVGISLLYLIIGLLISVILTFFALLFCHMSKTFKEIFLPIAILFNSIPTLALLPIIIMWFGIDKFALIVLIVQGTFWILSQQLVNALDNIPRVYKDFGRNIGLNSVQTLVYIVFGSLAVDCISGLRIAYTRAWRSLIGAEMIFGVIGSSGGLGYYLNFNRTFGQMDGVFAGIIIIIIISLLIDKCVFQNIEKRTIRKWGIKMP